MKMRLTGLLALAGLLAGCQSVQQQVAATQIEGDAYRGCLTSAFRTSAPSSEPMADKADVADFARAAGLPPPPKKPRAKPVKSAGAAVATPEQRQTAFAAAEAACQPQSEAFREAVLKTGASRKRADELTVELAASMREALVGPAQ